MNNTTSHQQQSKQFFLVPVLFYMLVISTAGCNGSLFTFQKDTKPSHPSGASSEKANQSSNRPARAQPATNRTADVKNDIDNYERQLEELDQLGQAYSTIGRDFDRSVGGTIDASLTGKEREAQIRQKIALREESIRKLLDTADQLRQELLQEYEEIIIHVELPNGETETRSFPKYDINGILEAYSYYKQALDKQPDKPQADLGLGNLALMEAMTFIALKEKLLYDIKTGSSGKSEKEQQRSLNRYERRIDSATRSARNKFQYIIDEINPNNATAHLGIAMSFAMAGKWKRALQKFSEVDELGLINANTPSASIAYAWYGFTLEQLSDISGAKEKYMLATEIRDPYFWSVWAEVRIDFLATYKK